MHRDKSPTSGNMKLWEPKTGNPYREHLPSGAAFPPTREADPWIRYNDPAKGRKVKSIEKLAK